MLTPAAQKKPGGHLTATIFATCVTVTMVSLAATAGAEMATGTPTADETVEALMLFTRVSIVLTSSVGTLAPPVAAADDDVSVGGIAILIWISIEPALSPGSVMYSNGTPYSTASSMRKAVALNVARSASNVIEVSTDVLVTSSVIFWTTCSVASPAARMIGRLPGGVLMVSSRAPGQ